MITTEGKQLVKSMIKANKCPKCKKGTLTTRKHKNYPHGKKSKAKVINMRHCRNCNYSEIVPKLNIQTRRF